MSENRRTPNGGNGRNWAGAARRQVVDFAQKVANTAREPLLVLDQDLRVIFANDAFRGAFKVDLQGTEGRPVYELGNGQWNIPSLRRLLEEVLPNDDRFEGYRVEHNFETVGRRIMVLNARRLEHEQLILLAFEDTTDRLTSEAALRESEARYRTLFERMDEAYAVVEVLRDRDGRWGDFRFLEVNPAFLEHTTMPWPVGKTATELLGTPNPRWAELYGQALDGGLPVRVEQDEATLGLVFDLNIFPLDRERNHVAVLFTNITERKRAEAALRESEERQTFLLQLSDALRPLADASEIQAMTTRFLGERLRVDRSMYGEVEGDRGAEVGAIRGQYVRQPTGGEAATIPFPERFTFSQFGAHTMAARYRGETLVVEDVETDPAFDAAERAAWVAAGVRAAIVATLVKAGRLVAEFGVHSAKRRAWSQAETALVREVAERTWAAAERARAEAALREGERRQAFLLRLTDVLRSEHSEHGVVERSVEMLAEKLALDRCYATKLYPSEDRTEVIHEVYKAGLAPMPRSLRNSDFPEALRQTFDRTLIFEDTANDLALTAADKVALAALNIGALLSRPLRRDGAPIFSLGAVSARPREWTASEVALVEEVVERVSEAAERARGAAALRESEGRARLLLAELQHRVRNILAMVRSVVRRTVETGVSVENVAEHLDGRLWSMARTQTMLTRSAGARVNLETLIWDEILAQNADEAAVAAAGPIIELAPKAAEVLTLAVHELATNATKYGAFAHPGAKLEVVWKVESDGPGRQRLRLVWQERGVPDLADAPRRAGFGTELIERRVPYELQGTGEVELRPGGVRAEITFPLVPGESILATDLPSSISLDRGGA